MVSVCFLLICCALLSHAQTTQCAYNFNSGVGNASIIYCVTVNGNIPQIQIPFGQVMIGADGEGYGICDQNIQPGGINYVDYGVIDTGNWNPPVLISKTSGSVKISRNTSDDRWNLTQTITKVANPPSIKVVMSLTNLQQVDDVAYLVRFADANPSTTTEINWTATLNSALAVPYSASEAAYGLLLQNMGTPQFGYWQGFAQTVPAGPNACAFAFNTNAPGNFVSPSGTGSIEIAYVGTVRAGKTNTATLTYRGF